MRRQGARDRTSGGEEIGQSHLTLETKALKDYLCGHVITFSPQILLTSECLIWAGAEHEAGPASKLEK